MKAPTITIEMPPESRALVAQLAHLPEATRAAIVRGMDKAGALVTGRIQAERLTGEGPFPVAQGRLGVVSGRLRGSVRWTRTTAFGTTFRQTIGTNVRYAGVHEFGYNGQVAIPAHTRRVFTEPKNPATGKPRRSKVRVATGIANVRAHTRWLQIPARAPFGHGLADHAAEYPKQITAELRALLQRSIGGGNAGGATP